MSELPNPFGRESFMGQVVAQLRPIVRTFRQALRFVWNSAPALSLAGVGIRAVQGILPWVGLYLIKLLIDALADALRRPEQEEVVTAVLRILIAMAVVAIISAAAAALAGLVYRTHAQVITDHMLAILHVKSVEVDLEYYENATYHDTLHRAQEEAPHRPAAILDALLQIGQDGISLLALCVILWSLHWVVLPILILAALPELFLRIRFSHMRYELDRKQTPLERRAWYLNFMLTHDSHAKEVRLFGLGARFQQWFQDARSLLRRERFSLDKKWALASLGGQACGIVGVFGVFALVVRGTMHGTLTVGDLVMYYQAVQRGTSYLESLGSGLSRLYENSLFLTTLNEFLSVTPRLVSLPSAQRVPCPIKTGVTFDNVSFRYPQESRMAIEGASLAIKPGEHIAFVGANGAGKTTLVKLLCRLYEPTSGKIMIDGTDLAHFDVGGLRGSISVIFQDFVRYQMTVRENIGLGVRDSEPDLNCIITAAKQAGIHEVVSQLPQGYETVLGKWFTTGCELSAGEWQKVALARAFLRDSQILILDEPTSAMDAKAEAELFSRFHELARGRIAILISHRLSTVKMVDRIYVVDQGRILESGTHKELMRTNGVYAELYSIQAQYYQ